MEVANLESAFERITVTDENEEQVASTTTYHKMKVCSAPVCSKKHFLTMQSQLPPRLYQSPVLDLLNQLQIA